MRHKTKSFLQSFYHYMPNILLLTTMYPDPLRPGTEVCHYFAREWVKMGYNVLVINYRSMFPRIYTDMATLFPKLAYKYIGNHVEMDRNKSIIQHEVEGIPVYSIPIFKYVPHGRYPKRVIKKQVQKLKTILSDRKFIPDAIIGHFHNPQFEIVGALKKDFPTAHTCVSLHELNASVLTKCYGKDCEKVINGVDMIGFRSVPIKRRFEKTFGSHRKSFVCWSGTSPIYLQTPAFYERHFNDGNIVDFLFVGQTIKRKYPKETIEAIHKVYGRGDFHLTYVGSKDIAYPETQQYIDDHGLGDKVTFLGQIPRDEIIKQYDRHQCFILISRSEVFGLVYLEAMARGCITVASKNEGMEGIIQDGVNGFLCKAGDVNELVSVIQRINVLPAAEKQRISDKARYTAEELSDYNVAKHYIETVMNS